MGVKDLVGKVNSLYHSSMNFFKNPRSYFVAPLALAAALSFSGRGYAYTKYTEILHDDFNREGQPLSTNTNYELVSGNITTDIESGGKANISAPAPDLDWFKVSGSFTGALRYTARFDIVPVNIGKSFGPGFSDFVDDVYNNNYAGLVVYNAGSGLEIAFDKNGIFKDPRWLNANNYVILRLTKDTNGNITAEYSEDGNPFQQIGTSHNVSNAIPDVYGVYDSASPEQYKLDELVMEEITEAVPTINNLAELILLLSSTATGIYLLRKNNKGDF